MNETHGPGLPWFTIPKVLVFLCVARVQVIFQGVEWVEEFEQQQRGVVGLCRPSGMVLRLWDVSPSGGPQSGRTVLALRLQGRSSRRQALSRAWHQGMTDYHPQYLDLMTQYLIVSLSYSILIWWYLMRGILCSTGMHWGFWSPIMDRLGSSTAFCSDSIVDSDHKVVIWGFRIHL